MDFEVPNLNFLAFPWNQFTRASFRASVKLCGIHQEQNFNSSCKIECIAVCVMQRDASIS